MRLNLHLCLWGVVSVCLLTGAATSHAQTIIYVDGDSTGPAHDGTTWCSAFVRLQDALDLATAGTVIRVANGVYKPDAAGLSDPRTATFVMLDGVEIDGGYAGCGDPTPDSRDIALYETVLSGDLNGNDAVVVSFDDFAACYGGGSVPAGVSCSSFDYSFDGFVDGADFAILLGMNGYSDNVYHVVTSSANAASAKLDGCTITAGNATGTSGNRNGGGMYVVLGSPTVSQCTFVYNAAINGAGMYNDLNTQTAVSNCTFASNFAYSGTASGLGGGALNFNGQSAFQGCRFIGNGAAAGGGIYSQNSSEVVRRSLFAGNLAGRGAGVYGSSSSPEITDSVLSGNVAVSDGGGVYAFGGGVDLVNVSVSQNEADTGAGVYTQDATVAVFNSILWGNVDGGGLSEAAQFLASGGTVTVKSSCIENLSAYSGNNNIGLDPMFAQPPGPDGVAGTADDDLSLPGASPCIDAGSNLLVASTTDYSGGVRIQDGDNSGTATVDMGAYELEYVPPPVCFAARDLTLPHLAYEPGVLKTIRIVLLPDAGTTAMSVEDVPPPGWTNITNISNSGVYDGLSHKVKWGPFINSFPPELTYDITPPLDALGEVCFSGITSVNGDKIEPTCGDACVDIQPCPFLPADEPQPACACADCSCGTCRDGRVEICEMIGYACAWKSGCNDEIAAMTRAAFLWQTGEFHCWDVAQGNWVSLPALPTIPGCCEGAFGLGGMAGIERPRLTDRENSAVVHTLGVRNVGNARLLNVPVTIHSSGRTVAVGLEIEVPEGWMVTKISDDGSWDDINRKVKWGPFFNDLTRVVRFGARGQGPKASLEGFAGTVSFDGFNEPVLFEPSRGE